MNYNKLLHNKKMKSGHSPIMIILLMIIILLIASGVAFYVLKGQGKLPGYSNDTVYQTPYPLEDAVPTDTPAPETDEISSDDDINTLQLELENTNEGSLETDFSELDSQAAGL